MNYSVVIPCFNDSTTIVRAIESVLAQSLLPQQIIVVDDASDDDSVAVVESIMNPLIECHTLPYNQGVAAARNFGWDKARSTFVAFLDADDEWHPQKMEVISRYLPALASPVMAHDYTYGSMPDSFSTKELNYYAISRIRFRSLLMHNSVVSCSVMVARDFPIRYDDRMRYCEDHDFLLRSAYILPIAYLHLPLARVHRVINTKGGLSGSLWRMRLGEIKMYVKLYRIRLPLIIISIPLVVYSLLKHIRLLFFKTIKKRYDEYDRSQA